MERRRLVRRDRASASGFTLVELLVVVGIIAVLGAVSAPAIANWMRNSTIRGAADQVVGELTTARLQAVKKNVNYGVVFVVLSDNTYQYFIEDAQPTSGMRQTYATAQQGPVRELPTGLQFVPAVAGPDIGLRFGRLGGMCDPDVSSTFECPDLAGSGITPPPSDNYVAFDNTNANPTMRGAVISLTQPVTGLTRTVVVSYGGRAMVLNR